LKIVGLGYMRKPIKNLALHSSFAFLALISLVVTGMAWTGYIPGEVLKISL